MKSIGEFLKDLREQKGVSTVEVQSLSNNRISQSYVVQVEQGVRTPSVAKLEAFADVLGVDVHMLVDMMLEKKKGRKPEPLIILSKSETDLIKHVRKLPEKKRKALLVLLLDSSK